MAMKLYPPIIEGALPAFYGTDTLSVPFSMNRAVGASEVAGFYLKIKTVSGSFIATLYSEDFDNLDEMYVNFNIRENEVYKLFNVGQYYKVQLAYAAAPGEPGYYSTVGVIKYTTLPTVSIEKFEFGQINQHNYNYVGVYSQDKFVDAITGETVKRDTTEKMYSCRFIIYNDDNSIFADSGQIIHKTQNDSVSYTSYEDYIFSRDLDINRTYYVRFIVKTTNGLEASSPRYRVIQRRSISPDVEVSLHADLDYDNGHINLSIINENKDKNPIISGAFLVSRASSKNGYIWEEFKRFDIQSLIPEKWGAVDCTVEQGVTYMYSLQQYNEHGVYSDRIISNEVFSDFEDSFLYDGEKQLKIRFNPKVTSFKNTIPETKVDTIGSQHPYIIRNGNVNYKDFPISGLISHKMDDTFMFIDEMELNPLGLTLDHHLTSDNITMERLFKLKVLEWLTNGKPKLFRSPSEGNYIVRLMNVSLSPIDTLGRMLHSFNSTAYEIAKYTTENLNYYNLIDTNEDFTTQTRWATVDLLKEKNALSDDILDDDLVQLNTRLVHSVSFADMFPGTIVYIDDMSVMIGATGAYKIESEKPITAIKIKKRDMNQGLFTYGYRSKAVNVFNLIERVHVEDVPCYQYIGEYPRGSYSDSKFKLKNIYELIEDARTEVLHTSFIRFTKRDVQDVYVDMTYEDYKKASIINNMQLYYDMDCKNPIPSEDIDKLAIYHLRCRRTDYRYYYGETPNIYDQPSNNEDYIVNRTSEYFAPYMDYYYDPVHDDVQPITPELFDIIINGEVVNIAETGKYILKSIDDLDRPVVKVNGGIITEISCAKQVITYSMENQSQSKMYPFLYAAKLDYEQKLAKFKNAFKKAIKGEIESAREEAIEAYKKYIKELEKAIEKYKEDNGIK